MPKITYRIGHEGAPVIETRDLNDSIFKEQYHKALKLTERFLKDPSDNLLQIIAFCGDRGFGKTSAMQTLAEIIKSSNHENNKVRDFLPKDKFEKLLSTKMEVINLIDPSFFDTDHNILELVLGRLYHSLQDYKKKNTDLRRDNFNNAIRIFSSIRDLLFSMHKDSKEHYNDNKDLDSLTAALDLQYKLREGVKEFLNVTHKDRLLLIVDDIDLNMDQAYVMCEQIRKYLAMEEVIVFIGIKYAQLEGAIQHEISKSIKKEGCFKTDEIGEMAKKYLDKFIPSGNRINLPGIQVLSDYEVEVYNGNTSIDKSKKLKSLLVKLIFKRTRYLFYNNKGGISHIVPDSLRGVMSLLGLLYGMPEITNQESQCMELAANKREFKDYFFHSWTKSLTPIHRKKALELVLSTADINLNKKVVIWLAETMKNELDREFMTEDEDGEVIPLSDKLVSVIKDLKNFSFNVSVGDVFHFLNLLNSDRLSPSDERMLFFLKSYYSIRLYECYDLQDMNIQSDEEGESYIYTADMRIADTTDLQRLVGGSYFTYLPGTLLSRNGDKTFVDTKIIRGSENQSNYLVALLEGAKKVAEEYDSLKENGANEHELAEMRKIFQLAEFFIMTISRSILQKDIDSFYNGNDSFRKGSLPAAFSHFYKATGYYVFDVMAPFTNLMNPEFAYGRFKNIFKDPYNFYEFAINHDFSLLRQMAKAKNPYANSKEEYIHAIKSDVTIRNGEVLTAVLENAIGRKTLNRNSEIGKIRQLYSDLSNSGMKTHAKTENDEYEIKFSFLNVLSEFLKNEIGDTPKRTNPKVSHNPSLADLNTQFFHIFNGADSLITKFAAASNNVIDSEEMAKMKKNIEVWLNQHIFVDGKGRSVKDIIETLRNKFPKLSFNNNSEISKYFQKNYDVTKNYSSTSFATYIVKSKNRLKSWTPLIKNS